MNYAELKVHEDAPDAPGELALLQRFLNLHDHAPGGGTDLAPPPEMLREFLVDVALLDAATRVGPAERDALMELYEAVHERLRAHEAGEPTAPFTRRIEDIADGVGFRLRFEDDPALEPAAAGAEAALGRLLAILFLAELDGRWSHMKECASPTCHSVFYDRSKNHSGKWCSMQSCGNQHKVRAWRERHRADAVDA
jgi:predicted RNA-binding Zn ribbon-like protein